jgi:hypothetical protein
VPEVKWYCGPLEDGPIVAWVDEPSPIKLMKCCRCGVRRLRASYYDVYHQFEPELNFHMVCSLCMVKVLSPLAEQAVQM